MALRGAMSGTLLRMPTLGRCMSSLSDEVLFNVQNNVGIITMNRPKQLNALTLNMIRAMHPKLMEWEKKMELVIIKGAGEKAFCAGGDVVAITAPGRQGDKADPLPRQFFHNEYRLNLLTGSLAVPYVALQDGITMGGGCGMSVHGKYRVCTEKTMFAMPETAIGFFPDVGGAHFLPRLRGRLGLFLALSGYRLKGRDNLHAGISTHVCDSASLDDLVSEIAEAGASRLEAVLDSYSQKAAFDAGKPFSLAPHLATIDRCFASDSVPDILAALQADGSEFATKIHATLVKMSPTAMVITTEQLRRGASLSLADCLRMELRMAYRFAEDHDFYEGVRALLVDKDQSPVWKPTTVAEVTAATVERYFSHLPADEELTF
ncbi:3-hydroxyisobutyryl-CoA hydrolase, mitochondrial-like [Pollicipes pollicipes]|uniref:3-hydroxyisobutyryl-CoA hydrolase, mitochondrial-like n=1 Tax=Pollicipes pollicipes TaxID=41117 RepID=UPI001884A497|nr:3-hydroxyisobutyryl-CoA hydrolase, mitochondrial-like [Pollicipes pollicipes]XP_037069425.1 3-hydroxyisobutyryl-CoA hydrolase, mitochondrial-like [Pollicipes pollicipes]XP_037069427.1 3-hydroxyisobutyryl-CoA hydrolase, mitochondrial-like [Pollicipes pollicipes]XP_037069428.1 3-hydroxyisobutyryl-CoA hydrolase, mitochondrial-like [Pollicipes pollicipes]XP_037071845.1 3-hydroxyisobutyryl-CoA hydrolase, mitochondrial-like [Pollicipes pollicipes]XP_037071846.1 3-hydroxyisobutyryl-CoA hydrolase, 